MNELAHILERLELSQYLESFVEEGFDTWDTVLYITETDLDALQVKLGHRRRLQGEIAHARGIPFEQLLAQSGRSAIPRQGSSPDPVRSDGVFSEGRAGHASGSSKRKYRRHPKPDENAPTRPPSAYVLFSNQVRDEIKPQKLTFTDIAKVVGERWQSLPPEEKEPYETKAAVAKENYNQSMAEYKKTSSYRTHMKYLADFKAKNTPTPHEGKRVKLETELSRGSSTSAGSPIEADSPTVPPGRPLRPPSAQPASPTSSNSTSVMLPYPAPSGTPSAMARPQLPRIVPMEMSDAPAPHPSNTRRTVNAPTASFLHQDTSRSSISSNISAGSTGSSSVFTPITPIEEHRTRLLPRQHQSSSTSSVDSRFALPPLSHSSSQDQPYQSPQYSSMTPMKRLSLTEDGSSERPTQRPRSNPPDGGPSPYLPPPSASASSPPAGTRDRPRERMDALSVLALAGNMVEQRKPDDAPPPPPRRP